MFLHLAHRAFRVFLYPGTPLGKDSAPGLTCPKRPTDGNGKSHQKMPHLSLCHLPTGELTAAFRITRFSHAIPCTLGRMARSLVGKVADMLDIRGMLTHPFSETESEEGPGNSPAGSV